jgi:hypothetical protein
MTTLSIQEKPLGLSSARIVLMAAACGFAVSTLYYNQPLLPQMGASFGRSSADTAPSDSVLTAYDEEHLVTYLRLLDAEVEGADWREVARIVLHLSMRSRTAGVVGGNFVIAP